MKKNKRQEKMTQLTIDKFFDLSFDLNCVTTMRGKILLINESWQDVTGYGSEELEGRRILDYMHPDDLPKIKKIIGALKTGNEERLNLTTRFRCLSGEYKVFEWSMFFYQAKAYATARVCTKHLERREKIGEIPLEELIAHERELFRTILLSIGDAIISTDEKCQIVLMNKVAEMLTGWSLEEAQGKNLEEVYVIEDLKTKRVCPAFVKEVIRSGQRIEIEELSLTQKDGKTLFIQDSVAAIRDKDEQIIGAVLVFHDFTEKRERLKQVEYLSFHDYLTGLYNRRYMADAIKRLDQERNLPLTFMVMDINGLKLVNDSFGHESGDRLIQKVADLIRTVTRGDDIIARTGGDEFAVILLKTNEEEAESIKKRIKEEAKGASFESVIVSVAVGYGIKTKKEEDVELIAKQADNAMYRDKIVSGKDMRSKMIQKIQGTINRDYDKKP